MDTSRFVKLMTLGYSSQTGYYLGISRTLTFFPFFIVGHYLSVDFITNIRGKIHSLYFCFTVVLVVFFFVYFSDMEPGWLWGSKPFSALGHNEWYAGFVRLILYIASFTMGISIMGILPDQLYKFTHNGSRTLMVFLWHGFIVKVLNGFGVIQLIGDWGTAKAMTIFLIMAFAITRSMSLT